mmetsp:Transcript_15020/g.33029  ORF Transcript_15020/g.33029 Transcript_15020/m.33029 type:complete len:221 (-) Transcript_15020:1381-2043(-)
MEVSEHAPKVVGRDLALRQDVGPHATKARAVDVVLTDQVRAKVGEVVGIEGSVAIVALVEIVAMENGPLVGTVVLARTEIRGRMALLDFRLPRLPLPVLEKILQRVCIVHLGLATLLRSRWPSSGRRSCPGTHWGANKLEPLMHLRARTKLTFRKQRFGETGIFRSRFCLSTVARSPASSCSLSTHRDSPLPLQFRPSAGRLLAQIGISSAWPRQAVAKL